MIIGENSIVVDKNVWADFYLPDRPLHDQAFRFINTAEKHNANLAIPADAVKDVFYVVGNHMKQLVRENGGTVWLTHQRNSLRAARPAVDPAP